MDLILQLSVFCLLLGSMYADDIACARKTTEYGYVCTCNKTYCDTIERPTPVVQGSYYHYMTSKDTPGFNKRIGTFANISVIELLDSQPSSDYLYFLVNTSVQYQKFTGVGAAFTDSTGINFNSLSSGTQQKFVESCFGEKGIEYVFGRVPIAASDFSLRFYSYDDVPGDINLDHFNLTEEDYKLKIPLIKLAMNASSRDLKLVGTPWTSPAWMKTNNSSRRGYLLSQYHRTWANYLLKFLEAYNDNGISFWGLSQGNELLLGFFINFQMPNLVLLPHQVKFWTKYYLGPMLKKSNFSNVKILTLDDERSFVNYWWSRLLTDKDAAQYIDGIALHWYMDSSSNLNVLDKFHEKYPDKFILYTESSMQGGISLGSWSSAVRYINNIIENYNHWSTGYLDWNLALNPNGGPPNGGMSLDAGLIVNGTNDEFYKQPYFYALGHFSKFISPGSKRVQVKTNQNASEYYQENPAILNELKTKMLKINSDNSLLPHPIQETTPPTPTGKPGPTGTGKPGPGPTQHPGPGPTGHPGPDPTGKPGPGPSPTQTPSGTTIQVVATTNPDGSHTVILHNPKSEPVNVTIIDLDSGAFNTTLEANSLNTFIYGW